MSVLFGHCVCFFFVTSAADFCPALPTWHGIHYKLTYLCVSCVGHFPPSHPYYRSACIPFTHGPPKDVGKRSERQSRLQDARAQLPMHLCKRVLISCGVCVASATHNENAKCVHTTRKHEDDKDNDYTWPEHFWHVFAIRQARFFGTTTTALHVCIHTDVVNLCVCNVYATKTCAVLCVRLCVSTNLGQSGFSVDRSPSVRTSFRRTVVVHARAPHAPTVWVGTNVLLDRRRRRRRRSYACGQCYTKRADTDAPTRHTTRATIATILPRADACFGIHPNTICLYYAHSLENETFLAGWLAGMAVCLDAHNQRINQ